ncbi:MAG: hypothetical protein ACR2P6_07455 [Gammaproteobacteria bacterium]
MVAPIAGGAIASSAIASSAIEPDTNHELTATGIAAGAPVVGSPVLSITTELIANGITATPVVGAPAITQLHVLSTTGIATAAPTVDSSAITQLHVLVASEITTTPVVGAPALTESQALNANDIATGAPTVGSPALTQVHQLSATGIATGAPTIDSPAITQLHVLVASEIIVTPVVGVPALDQTADDLVAAGISADAPTVGKPEIFSGTFLSRWTSGILDREFCDVAIVLVKISHDELDVDINVNNSGKAIYHAGEWYTYYPFDIELPSDNENEPIAQIRIANVDREISQGLEALFTPATISMSVVSSPNPDEVLKQWAYYELRNVNWNAIELTGDVVIRTFNNEPFPKITVRPSNFQNLFRA